MTIDKACIRKQSSLSVFKNVMNYRNSFHFSSLINDLLRTDFRFLNHQGTKLETSYYRNLRLSYFKIKSEKEFD